MNDAHDAAAQGVWLLLPETERNKLARLRDQLELLSQISYAATAAEDDEPLQIRRAVLGLCFETAASQIGDVLLAVERAGMARGLRGSKH